MYVLTVSKKRPIELVIRKKNLRNQMEKYSLFAIVKNNYFLIQRNDHLRCLNTAIT